MKTETTTTFEYKLSDLLDELDRLYSLLAFNFIAIETLLSSSAKEYSFLQDIEVAGHYENSELILKRLKEIRANGTNLLRANQQAGAKK